MAMKTRAIAVLLACSATPLFANNPPGPQMMFSLISILPFMALLTFVGGGYALMRRLNIKGRAGVKTAGVVLAFVFGAVSEGCTLIVALIFSWLAITRAIHLIRWGMMARGADPDGPFSEVKPGRMTTAGIVLIPIVLIAAATNFAFLGAWDLGIEYRYQGMRKYVAYRLALRTPLSSERLKLESDSAKNFKDYNEYMNGFRDTRTIRLFRIEEQKNNHFAVYLLPAVLKFPFWPYDRWFSAPTYRADDTGAIRMSYVHSRQLCPSNAPIVDRVGPADITSVLNGDTNVEPAERHTVPGSKRR
jgi:hypothetical protein